MRSPYAAASLLVMLGCGAAADDPYQPVLCGGGADPCVDVRFVAHEDDDLLFMNPDLAASLAAGNRVVTVFVTAGTATDPARLTMRELGMLNAYAFMAAPDDAVAAPGDEAAMLVHWRLHDGQPIGVDLGGGLTRYAIQYDHISPLPSGGLLSLVFLRVVEMNGVDLGTLLRGEVAQVPTVPCAAGCVLGSDLASQSYDRDQLVDMLEALIERFDDRSVPGGLAVSTLDATQLYHREVGYGLGWIDHADHLATAALAVASFVRHHRRPHATPQTLYQYRAYNIGRERANLGAETRGKRQVFYRYFALGEPLDGLTETGAPIEYTNRDPDDPHFTLDTYEAWTERRYVLSSLPPAQGRLAVGDPPRCLRASDGAAELGPCDEAPAWDSTGDELRPSSDGATCLVLDGDTARVAPCLPLDDAERRTFVLTSTGQIRTRGGGCLQADASGVTSAACDKRVDKHGDPIGRPVPAQSWSWR
ncbi:MAG TPA: hypothetical protein VN253_01200 [Kofleriaceae bacterium]|nr:hypothetical protein [Kofleriaceae bacterium]